MNVRLHFILISACMFAGAVCQSATAQDAHQRPHAWTKSEALAELSLRPRDPYIQFVALQLCSLEDNAQEAAQILQRVLSRRDFATNRNLSVDLYSIFSGWLAIQESLQLDALTQRPAAAAGEQSVLVSSLQGPQVKSHPWPEMLGGKRPPVSRLAECIPADQLLVRFQSVSKLLQMRELAEQWSTYVTSQTQHKAYSAGLIEQVQQQLAVKTNDLLRPVYDAAIAEIGLTSSDLFFREGTDVSLVLRLNEPQLIRSQLDGFLESAAKEHDGATTSGGEFLGVAFKHVTTPDRTVHVFSAYPQPDLHVRTNSRVAMERLLSAIIGQPYAGVPLQRMSETDEFRYIRTLMPLGAEEENGFVYMSDPFIRKLIGPEKKLTQRGRLVCRSHLQMISYASLLYRTQYGLLPASLAELRSSGCLGAPAAPLELICPNGGHYQLADDCLTGCCSQHGTSRMLIPCCDIPVERVSPAEAQEYRQFVEAYSRYWNTFFDRIAIRLQHTGKKTRVETIVLPLINNSIYSGLASTLGGSREDLDQMPVPARNIFSIGARIDKQRILANLGIERPAAGVEQVPEQVAERKTSNLLEITQSLQQLALAMHNFESAYKHFPPLPLTRASGIAARADARADARPKPSGLS